MRWLGEISSIGYKRPRIPSEIIRYGFWLNHRFASSLRDRKDLQFERGLTYAW